MATASQIAANRRNAQKSTGPRTVEGKAASCFNALKHGIDAHSQCLPSEDPAALEQLAAEYHERFAPATPEERALVDILISTEWDLRRYRVASAQLWQWSAIVSPGQRIPMAGGFEYKEATFARLQRVIDSAQRNFTRALAELRKLQELRPASEDPVQPEQSKPASDELASFRKSPAPADSHQPGTVFPPLPAVPPLVMRDAGA
jgi:hypothetical protein